MLKILALVTLILPSYKFFFRLGGNKSKILCFNFSVYINYRFSNPNSVLIFLLNLILYFVINYNHYIRVNRSFSFHNNLRSSHHFWTNMLSWKLILKFIITKSKAWETFQRFKVSIFINIITRIGSFRTKDKQQ